MAEKFYLEDVEKAERFYLHNKLMKPAFKWALVIFDGYVL